VPQARSLRPVANEIESHSGNKQRDREVDEHYVLRMLCEQHSLGIKRIQNQSFLEIFPWSDLKERDPTRRARLPTLRRNPSISALGQTRVVGPGSYSLLRFLGVKERFASKVVDRPDSFQEIIWGHGME
jgi:hypothetical protein